MTDEEFAGNMEDDQRVLEERGGFWFANSLQNRERKLEWLRLEASGYPVVVEITRIRVTIQKPED